jgi:hypothetical protein
MKKIALTLFVLCLVIVSAGVGLLLYIRPEHRLNLSYKPLAIDQKVMNIIAERKLEVTLTEHDMNQLLKEWLSANRMLSPQLEITGAEASIHNDLMTVDVNLSYYGRVSMGAQLKYKLSWSDPYLYAELEQASVKKLDIPKHWIRTDKVQIPIGEQLPPRVNISKVEFADDSLKIRFKIRLF